MEKYIGTKTIEAESMSLGSYNKYRGWDIPKNENPERDGYLVRYPDGYESWSPKEVFEEAYHELLLNVPLRVTDTEDIPFQILQPVFPSNQITSGVKTTDEYGGAHEYQFMNSKGFNNGEAQYDNSYQRIQFVKKESDGSMTPGLQSEQLLIALIDRHKKLNNKFPSREGALAITKMEEALQWLEARVKERIFRGVMGDLKK